MKNSKFSVPLNLDENELRMFLSTVSTELVRLTNIMENLKTISKSSNTDIVKLNAIIKQFSK